MGFNHVLASLHECDLAHIHVVSVPTILAVVNNYHRCLENHLGGCLKTEGFPEEQNRGIQGV